MRSGLTENAPYPRCHRNAGIRYPKPVSGRLLDLTDYVRDRARRAKAAEQMNVIFYASHAYIRDVKVSGSPRHVRMKVQTSRSIEKRTSTPCGEDYVDMNG